MNPPEPTTCQKLGKNSLWWGLGNTSILVTCKIVESAAGVTAPLSLIFGAPFLLTFFTDTITKAIVYNECCGGGFKMHHAKLITACASALFFSAMVALCIVFTLLPPLGIGLLIGFGVLNVLWNAGCAIHEYNKLQPEVLQIKIS